MRERRIFRGAIIRVPEAASCVHGLLRDRLGIGVVVVLGPRVVFQRGGRHAGGEPGTCVLFLDGQLRSASRRHGVPENPQQAQYGRF